MSRVYFTSKTSLGINATISVKYCRSYNGAAPKKIICIIDFWRSDGQKLNFTFSLYMLPLMSSIWQLWRRIIYLRLRCRPMEGKKKRYISTTCNSATTRPTQKCNKRILINKYKFYWMCIRERVKRTTKKPRGSLSNAAEAQKTGRGHFLLINF